MYAGERCTFVHCTLEWLHRLQTRKCCSSVWHPNKHCNGFPGSRSSSPFFAQGTSCRDWAHIRFPKYSSPFPGRPGDRKQCITGTIQKIWEPDQYNLSKADLQIKHTKWPYCGEAIATPGLVLFNVSLTGASPSKVAGRGLSPSNYLEIPLEMLRREPRIFYEHHLCFMDLL